MTNYSDSSCNMSCLGVGLRRGPKNTDYDAAQALLDLQSNKKQEPNAGPRGWRDLDSKEDIEKAAKLILSCFITSDDSSQNINPASVAPIIPNRLKDTDRTEICGRKIRKPHKVTSRNHMHSVGNRYFNRSIDTIFDSSPSQSSKRYTKMTRDIGTQTEEKYLNPNIDFMEITIKNLCDRIKNLEAQIKTGQPESADQSVDDIGIMTEKRELDISYEDNDNEDDPDFEMSLENDSNVNESKYSYSCMSHLESSAFNDRRSHQTNKHVVYNGILNNHAGNSDDMVPIGDGYASVPSRILKHINWNSYSSATRKLLTAVFSRRILATHSLTGKPSPAFPNKPAKKRLDPELVNDIVQTVVERCRVPENVVRTSITTKCADESKMFRTREKTKKKRSNKKNRENVSPISDSDFNDC